MFNVFVVAHCRDGSEKILDAGPSQGWADQVAGGLFKAFSEKNDAEFCRIVNNEYLGSATWADRKEEAAWERRWGNFLAYREEVNRAS